jgi:hypothetical protein
MNSRINSHASLPPFAGEAVPRGLYEQAIAAYVLEAGINGNFRARPRSGLVPVPNRRVSK